jgi:hypothetical protein
LILGKTQGQPDGQVIGLNSTVREVFEHGVKPRLATQHAQDQLVTKSSIVTAQVFVRSGQQGRRVSAIALDSPQNIKGGATCGRNWHFQIRLFELKDRLTLGQWTGLEGAQLPAAVSI